MGGDANVKLVREAFEAIIRDDLDAVLERTDPEIEFCPLTRKLVAGRSYRGHDGLRQWRRDAAGIWEPEEGGPYSRLQAGGYVANGDRVISHGLITARGQKSGAEMDMQVSWVSWIEDGKIVRCEAFAEREDAERAAGLLDD